jgi:hypothetical protein
VSWAEKKQERHCFGLYVLRMKTVLAWLFVQRVLYRPSILRVFQLIYSIHTYDVGTMSLTVDCLWAFPPCSLNKYMATEENEVIALRAWYEMAFVFEIGQIRVEIRLERQEDGISLQCFSLVQTTMEEHFQRVVCTSRSSFSSLVHHEHP